MPRLPAAARNQLGILTHQRDRFYAHRLPGVELRFVVDSSFVRLSLQAQEADTTVVLFRGDVLHPLDKGHGAMAGVLRRWVAPVHSSE